MHVLQIPLNDFVLTNSGEVVQQQMAMMHEKIRSIGISILGGNANVSGQYELGIDSIRAVNEVTTLIVPSVRAIADSTR